MSFTAYLVMKRAVLSEKALAYSGVRSVDLLPSFPGLGGDDTSSLADDAAFYEIAASLRNPLSAVLMTRATVLQPDSARVPLYDKPENWGDLHQWEAIGIGYGISGGEPWMALSLYYPDPDAAKADAEELALRMLDYDTATALMYPEFREQQLAAMVQRPIENFCGNVKGSYTGSEKSSTLTMTCDVVDNPHTNIWWSVLINLRDLGFLLP